MSICEGRFRIKPDSVAALSNLAASYARLGKFNLAIEEFTKAVEAGATRFSIPTTIWRGYIHATENVGKRFVFGKSSAHQSGLYDNGYDFAGLPGDRTPGRGRVASVRVC